MKQFFPTKNSIQLPFTGHLLLPGMGGGRRFVLFAFLVLCFFTNGTLAPRGQLSVWEAPLWGAALISDTVRPFSPISSPQRSQCPSSLRTKGTNLLAAAAGIPENSEWKQQLQNGMALHTAADSSRVVLGLGRKTQKSPARGSKGSIRKQWGSSAPPPEASGPY